MLTVLFYLVCVGLFLTLSLMGPIFVALFASEIQIAIRFGFYLLLGGFVFGGPLLAMIGRVRDISPMGRLVLMFLVWTLLPAMATIPLYDITELSFVDALFETFSGITTTGSTTINTVGEWPQSILFWRVQLQWLGGLLTLLTIMLILAPMGIGGLTTRKSTLTVGADLNTQQGRLIVFMINLTILYATITAICFFGFFITGTRAFYAATMAMTATSTGGFLPFDESLDQIIGPAGQLIFALFLIAGATSVFWHRMLLKGQVDALRHHRESYSVIIGIMLLAIAFTGLAVTATGAGVNAPATVFIQGLLNASSLVATSGVQTQPGYFTLLPLVVVLFVVVIGGSAFSTSGGIKHYRIGAMLAQSRSELDRLVYPNLVKPTYFGSERFDIDVLKAIWSFFMVAILTISLGSVVIATSGLPFEAALTATIAAFSTAGPVYSPTWSGADGAVWPTYSAFPDSAKLTLIALMTAGRLEVIALLGLVNPQYWRSR